MSTAEIAKAVGHLQDRTLRDALATVGKEPQGERETLLKQYQNAVLDVGVENFISKLQKSALINSCQVLNIPGSTSDQQTNPTEKSNDEELERLRSLLSSTAVAKGISTLLSVAETSLLTSFCETLGLESSDREDMIKQIADEVMLTGMECFLNKMSLALLKSHCSEMEQTSTGTKPDLVERLMVHIFELEPLDEDNAKTAEKKMKTNGKGEKNKN